MAEIRDVGRDVSKQTGVLFWYVMAYVTATSRISAISEKW